jgi:hypothetical protein
VVRGRSLGFALLSNTRAIAFFDLLLAVVTGWLLWRSLGGLWSVTPRFFTSLPVR